MLWIFQIREKYIKSRFRVFPRNLFEESVENHIVYVVKPEFHYPGTDYAVLKLQLLGDGEHRRKVSDDRKRKRYYNDVMYYLAAKIIVFSRTIRNRRRADRLQQRAAARIKQRVEKHSLEIYGRIESRFVCFKGFKIVENACVIGKIEIGENLPRVLHYRRVSSERRRKTPQYQRENGYRIKDKHARHYNFV